MKKFLLLCMLLMSINIISQTMEIRIVPEPKKVTLNGGTLQLKKNVTIAISDDKNKLAAEKIQQSLKEFAGLSTSIIEGSKGDIILSLTEDKTMPMADGSLTNEAYNLRITGSEVIISSSSPKGIFYGAMSLLQIIEKSGRTLPLVEIIDSPDMKIRGISDDISRGQVSTLQNFKKIIDHISRYKMNVFMPYMEDLLVLESYPTIGVNRGALTKKEVKELVDYAAKHFVEVVPIYQTLGHYENILSQPEFLKYAEFTGAASLNVSSDETYVFLENMLKEIFEMFPSKYFHMGADESWDVGLGKSKYLVEQSDLATVHANHYKKVYDICKKYGKEVIMYGDIILHNPSILSQIPKDITIVDWQYGVHDEYKSTKVFKDAGFNYYVSPAVWNYLTPFPFNANTIPNVQNLTRSGLKNDAAGMINSNWGDFGAETIKELILYGYAWSAQCAWNFGKSDINKFNKDYFYDFYGVDDDISSHIYKTFADPLNQMTWLESWRHPALPFRTAGWWEAQVEPSKKITSINTNMPLVISEIIKLKKSAKKNKDHLTILEFNAKFNLWFANRLETQYMLQDYKTKEPNTKAKAELLKKIEGNIAQLKSLKKEYSKIWKTYYKKDNLWMIEEKFDRLNAYFTEIANSINADKFGSFNPAIESKWIYVNENDTLLTKNAEFKTTFNLNAVPDKALFQLLGDTYAKLSINGEFVDEVYARPSLSLSTERKIIKMIDVKKYLKTGVNEIKVEVVNYNAKGGAGFNLSSYIKTGKDVINVNTTNEKTPLYTWVGTVAGKNEWKNVTVKNHRFIFTAPNFETGRKSWIER